MKEVVRRAFGVGPCVRVVLMPGLKPVIPMVGSFLLPMPVVNLRRGCAARKYPLRRQKEKDRE